MQTYEELKKENDALKEALKIGEIMLGIYQINMQAGDHQMYLEQSLAYVMDLLKANYCTIFKKEADIFTWLAETSNSPKGVQENLVDCSLNQDEISLVTNQITQLTKDKDTVYLMPIIVLPDATYYFAVSSQEKLNTNFMHYAALTFKDVVMSRIKEQNMQDQAIKDTLTNLFNRRYYEQITPQIEKQAHHVAFMMIDLFRLKYVNDNFGHKTGDTYIKTIASILNKNFRDDLVFRLGGDEFAIIIVDKAKEYVELAVNQALEDIKNTPVLAPDGTPINSRIDLGIEYSGDAIDFKQLFDSADATMNANKNAYYRANNIDRRK